MNAEYDFVLLQRARPSASVVHRLRIASVNARRAGLDQHAPVCNLLLNCYCDSKGKVKVKRTL